jgi:hypothetical protein
MDGGRRQGRPDEELFLRPSKNDPETPTVGPLRINKRESSIPGPSTSPPPRAGSATSSTGSGPRPAVNQLPYPVPPTNPPTGPLPYPDDRYRTSKNSTPEDGRRRRSSATAPSGSPRTKFDASDPNRPTVSGYAQLPTAQSSKLGERRGNTPKPLPDSPGPQTPDKEGLFQKQPQRPAGGLAEQQPSNPFPDYHQQYWPPSSASADSSKAPGLKIPNPGGINRLSSTASTSTTKAQRGSPPPPETPILGPPPGGIEARYAAAGIAGASTLSSIQAQNAAAAQRANQYSTPLPSRPDTTTPSQQLPQTQLPQQQPQQQQPPRRPWTPTEQPGSQPHGPPTVYQGASEVTTPPQASQSPPSQAGRQFAAANEHPLEQDFQRMNMHEEPPPAYSSVSQAPSGSTGYPNEKRPMNAPQQPTPGPSVMGDANLHGHPAFANEPRASIAQSPQPVQPTAIPAHAQAGPSTASPGPGPGPASPPPLPEGWIAHLDPSSGQYYYIHLPTQSTQWEFPKGPTPLNLNEPMSPTGGTFVNPLTSPGFSSFSKPMASPGIPGQQVAFHEGSLGAAALSSPTAAGFTGPPPTAGVEMYKVAPTNGVYFGPYLRYTNMDIERGLWLGSILLVTDAPHPPTIHIHQSLDLSPNPRQLKANPIFSHQRWMFYRYDIDLKMEDDHAAKWTYAVTSHLGCTRYEFLVAGRHETSWRFIAHSGNDFALNVSANERTKLGGVGFMWKDVLQKHAECGGFHVQLGLGNQVYADRIWKEIPLLKQWTATSGKENRKNATWTARHEEDVSHAYFHYYTSHFDQPHVREAFAQIPHVLSLDDHDM